MLPGWELIVLPPRPCTQLGKGTVCPTALSAPKAALKHPVHLQKDLNPTLRLSQDFETNLTTQDRLYEDYSSQPKLSAL